MPLIFFRFLRFDYQYTNLQKASRSEVMNVQFTHSASSTIGIGRQRVDKDMRAKVETKLKSLATQPFMATDGGGVSSSDRLVYLASCLVGHKVEVQVKNGSMYSGIFHATNTEKDFGIILKVARLMKDESRQKSVFDSPAPSKILIIPSKELVQVIAKDVAITMDGLKNELLQGKHQELMIDSLISQSEHNIENQKVLEPWIPDENDPQYSELENIFENHSNRSWDQFETNKALFGIRSTFDEELYTTKLERGPQTGELEKEASKIAREIEAEDTRDVHLIEERGFFMDENLDEESKYSSVLRGIENEGKYVEEEYVEEYIEDVEEDPGDVEEAIDKDTTEDSVSIYLPNVETIEHSTNVATSNCSVNSNSRKSESGSNSCMDSKLNPNAKSFTPSCPPLRSQSPSPEGGAFYFPANMAVAQNMHSLPPGIGVGPHFAVHQSIMYNPQVATQVQVQMQNQYLPTNMPPQYGQQFIISQPRPVVYMQQNYPSSSTWESQYGGRDF